MRRLLVREPCSAYPGELRSAVPGKIVVVNTCPHTFEPHPHDFRAARGAAGVCDTCGGLVQRCPHCQALNRLGARFCVACGRRTPSAQPKPALHAAGQVREAIRLATDRKQSLDRMLELPAGCRPFLWMAGPAGVLVFGHRDAAGPTRLDLLDGHALHALRRRTLAEDLPSAQIWLSPPLVTEWGVFLAGPDSLHLLRAHGGHSPFERLVWRPPAGQTIRAVGAMHDGGALVLATGADGRAGLFAVNGQDEPGTRLWAGDMECPADHGVWLGSLADGTLWLIVGATKWLIAPREERPRRSPLGHMRPVPASWHRRLTEDLFDPEIIRTDGQGGGGDAVVVPGQDRGVLVIRLEGANARLAARLTPHGWVAPDWAGNGLLVGQERAVACYGPGGMLWSLDVDFAVQARPVVAPDWLCVAGARNDTAAVASGMATQIVFYRRSEGDDTAPRQYVSAQIPGLPVRGLPPLLVGGTLVLASRIPGERDLRLLVVSVASLSGQTGA